MQRMDAEQAQNPAGVAGLLGQLTQHPVGRILTVVEAAARQRPAWDGSAREPGEQEPVVLDADPVRAHSKTLRDLTHLVRLSLSWSGYWADGPRRSRPTPCLWRRPRRHRSGCAARGSRSCAA